MDENLALNYTAHVTGDQISSTTLEHSFTDRNYYKISILPEYLYSLSNEGELIIN